MTRKDVSASDFITGVFAELAKRGYLTIERSAETLLHQALYAAYEMLAQSSDYQPRFIVSLDHVGKSTIVEAEISNLLQRGFATTDMPGGTLRLSEVVLWHTRSRLSTNERKLYVQLADVAEETFHHVQLVPEA